MPDPVCCTLERAASCCSVVRVRGCVLRCIPDGLRRWFMFRAHAALLLSRSPGVAPVGPSCAGELLCRTLLSVIGAQKDNIHFFLRDPRNLAAGLLLLKKCALKPI